MITEHSNERGFTIDGSTASGERSTLARILVIDDDPGMRDMLVDLLQSAGYETLCAADGQEGVALHRATPAALAIVDLVMPVKNGVVAIDELRQASPGLHLIAITGQPNMGHILSVAQRLGAGKVVQKPFRPEELLAAVEEALNLRVR